MRNDNDFADVTLISDDKVKFSAHKVLLSSCSNMFNFILKSNSTHTNPLLFLGGVSSVNLGFMLDYIYHGEVKIFQEQLDSFIESAKKLEIEGLLGNSDDTEAEDSQDNIKTETETHHENNIKQCMEDQTQYKTTKEKRVARMNDNTVNNRRQFSKTSAWEKIDVTTLNRDEIEDKMKKLYEKSDGVWNCLACDYTTKTNSGTQA